MSKVLGLIVCAAVLALTSDGKSIPARALTTHAPADAPIVTHGVIVGDVRASSALLWARADREATLNVILSDGRHTKIDVVPARAVDDDTALVPLEGLAPATTYNYRAWFSLGAPDLSRGPTVEGSFRTAPPDDTAAPVRLAFGGDLAGLNVCRDAAEGFPIMDAVRARRPDVFVGLGDMIYADNNCRAIGLYGNAQVPGEFEHAANLAAYWMHWRYGRADTHLQRLLASTDYVGVWDDHEVVNDFGPRNDTRSRPPYTPGAHLMPIGLEAFIDYTPVAVAANTPLRLYRSIRWGKNLELFVLDTRQYRDPNLAKDTDARPKTMLGREQLSWLKQQLVASDATWKVIVSSVPMSIPTGSPPKKGRDGWANFDQHTGYEHELLGVLRFMQAHAIHNSVWITTDAHFAEAFRYSPFPEDPGFVVHELVTGPMNAEIFPNTDFDTTLNPKRLGFFAPASTDAVMSWTQAKHWFNFGELEIGDDRSLTMRVVNTTGETEFERTLAP